MEYSSTQQIPEVAINSFNSFVVLQQCEMSQNHATLLIYKYELKKEKKIVQDNNTGSFYKFINEKLLCKRGVKALCDNTGSPVTDDSTRATLLNNFFGSVCTQDNGEVPPFAARNGNAAPFSTVQFTSQTVLNSLYYI